MPGTQAFGAFCSYFVCRDSGVPYSFLLHSFNECLLSTCCVLGTVLGPEETAVGEACPSGGIDR